MFKVIISFANKEAKEFLVAAEDEADAEAKVFSMLNWNPLSPFKVLMSTTVQLAV